MNDKTEPWKWGDENQPKPEEPPHIEGQRHLCCGYDAYMRPFDKGNWVAYEDYAKLRMERIHDLNQIGGLQEENARLKAEVTDLKSTADRFKAQRMSEPKNSKDALEFIHTLDSIAIKKQKEEIDRLKAEVERLKGIILAQSSEFVRNATKHEEQPLPDGWNSAVAKACDILAEKEKEIRLWREAGELMLDHINSGFTAEYRVVEAIKAAKEGKPSV